jgi:hypothetical protein
MRIRKSLVLLFGAIIVLGIATTVAIAAATRTVVSGTAVTGVKVVRETNGIGIGTGLNNWVNIPGASVGNIIVPAGQTAFLLIDFSSPTSCQAQVSSPGTSGEIECWVRVLVNGTPALPTVFWQHGTTKQTFPAAHSLQYSTNRLPAGTYTVQAQMEGVVSSGSPSGIGMQFNGFSLSVTKVR